MYKLTLVIISILLIIPLSDVRAQTYPFSNIIVENGLSQGQVSCVFQDDDGVVWLGTSGGGITKYDGHSFEYIKDKDGLADNVVYCIYKYKTGVLLIGTNNGLSIYNSYLPKNNRFTNYTTTNGLNHNRVFTITKDSKGQILLGTGQGISVFKDSFCVTLKTEKTLDESPVIDIMEDSKHHIWYSTLGSGVFQSDETSIKNYTTKNGLGHDMVFSTFEYQPNVYWFCTGEGLFELNHGKLAFINPANLDSSTTYYTCLKDKNNVIWIGSGKGVIKCDSNKSATLFNTENGLVNNNIWKLFQDRENNLWFASNEFGVSKLNSERFHSYNSKKGLLNDEIKAVYEDKLSQLWIGSKLGLSKFNTSLTTNYTIKQFGGNTEIWDIVQDHTGNILVGTSNGLVVRNNNKFKRISNAEKNGINVIFSVLIDNHNQTWLGTQEGIAKINYERIELVNATSNIKKIVWKIYQDKKGLYWFGTDNGLYVYDNKHINHFTEKQGMTQQSVYGITEDLSGNIWLATNAGVYRYSNGLFTVITEKQGLSSNNIYSIVSDQKGNVWAGSSLGLDKISESNGNYKIKSYTNADGFMGKNCSQNGMIVDKDGKLWIGTGSGLVVYQPEYDRDNTLEPKTKLKRIDLFNQETDWNLFADSVDANNIPLNLELPYNKNYLKFMFVGVSLTTPSKVSYQYMLKGRDTSWTPTTKTEIPFDNMSPGEYEFLVKAQNGEGVWNKEPISFKFTITPPFWKTWWFYSIVILIVLMGIYSYIKIRTANFKILKQNEIIEEKNAALQYANEEIAEKNQSITDSINYAKRIQQSFLTSEKTISNVLKDHFILYKPRDIVSGDFYWAFDLPDRTLIACSDCTGHGIPGAFMSLIGISLLNEISHSKGIIEPAKILNELRRIIICALNPEQIESGGKDGMDISLISIFKSDHPENINIRFSGANSSLYVVSENTSILEFKGDKQPVGFYSMMTPFVEKEITAKKGDTLYLYTDGYADQFGGVNGKKFMSKQLKQQLSSISHLPLKEQELYLEKTLKDWQGNLEQVDDVTVIGIKL